MKKAVLVIDIGNTSTAAGLYQRGRVWNERRLPTSQTSVASLSALIRKMQSSYKIEGVGIASVVPSVDSVWKKVLHQQIGSHILWANHTVDIGTPISYPKPKTIGADRLANACWVAGQHKGASIVADFGTALTFDIVIPKEGYVGGVIVPGLPLMFSYLAEKTAKLPHIKPGPVQHAVGKSTEEAMKLGAQWGYRGMVKEIFSQLIQNLRLKNVKLYATGGYASWVIQGMDRSIILDPYLTLRGLGRMVELNKSL